MELKIGKVYTFDYESKTKIKSSRPKVKARLNEDEVKGIKKYLKKNEIASIDRFEEMCAKADEINGTKDKALQAEMKAEFKETFGSSSDEKPANIKAQNLFFRAYKPDAMAVSKDGGVKAIFAGWNCTVKGTVTYKWYVISETTVDEKYLTEELLPYVKVDNV